MIPFSEEDDDSEEEDKDWINKVNAIIRINLNVDPDDLSDKEWSRLYNEIVYVKKLEHKALNQIFKNALFEVASKIFPKK